MAKDRDSPEHVMKIGLSIMHSLAGEFHKEAAKPEGEKDFGLLTKLSQAVGYQSQLFSALKKSHEYERRLQKTERAVRHLTPENLVYENNPVISAERELESLQKHQ